MLLLFPGKAFPFAVLIGLFLVIYYLMTQAGKAKELPYIRKVAALDAIEEAVERSSEMNRPVMSGYGLDSFGPNTLAALSITGYIAKIAARTHTTLYVPAGGDIGTSIIYPQAVETVRNAYDDEGRIEDFKPENVIFLSEDQFAWATGQIGLIHEKNIAAAAFTGLYGPEQLALSEEAESVGAIVIAGSGQNYQQTAVLACIADYVLIGEELYAAGAYLSKDPVEIGSLRGQDWGKIFVVGLIVVGAVVAIFGYNIVSILLSV